MGVRMKRERTEAAISRATVREAEILTAQRPGGRWAAYSSRSADAIGSRAARMAGSSPPISPIRSE